MKPASMTRIHESAGAAGPVLLRLTPVADPRRASWQDSALCAETDPEAFFPEKGESTRLAKAVCRECSVTPQCLAYALETSQAFGVWGGLSERERHAIASQSGEAA